MNNNPANNNIAHHHHHHHQLQANDVFDLVTAEKSNIPSRIDNTTQYYCVFRNLWTPQNHPQDYPKQQAGWSTPVLLSHSKLYFPFRKDQPAGGAIEKLAEDGSTDEFENSFEQAGQVVNDYAEGSSFSVNDRNYLYLPPIKVSFDQSYISGIAGMEPSPDWFTGFYQMDSIDEYSGLFWESFQLQTYPWDAGTDDGTTYTAADINPNPVHLVQRFTPETAPNGIFVNGNEIRPVSEWGCVLHTCPLEEPDCVKPDWPPSTDECDVFKFPDCSNNGSELAPNDPTPSSPESSGRARCISTSLFLFASFVLTTVFSIGR